MKTIRQIFALLLVCFTLQVNAQEQLTLASTAPDFNGIDQNGEQFSLTEALKKGPVIISFYRGSWCPYCMKQFKEVQARYSEISGRNAQFVAVTPDKVDGIQKTVKLIGPSFKILRDHDLTISHSYKAISDEKFNMFEGDLGTGRKFLPVPATYVIGQDGKIKFTYFDANYKVRAILNEVIESLKH